MKSGPFCQRSLFFVVCLTIGASPGLMLALAVADTPSLPATQAFSTTGLQDAAWPNANRSTTNQAVLLARAGSAIASRPDANAAALLADQSTQPAVDPAAESVGAHASWRARMQQDLTQREYHATWSEPSALRAAVEAGLPGADQLAVDLDQSLLQSPNRAHGLMTQPA